MDLVDHVDLKARAAWSISSFLQQSNHLINTTIAGSIHLNVIHKTSSINFGTGLAFATGC